MGPHFLRKLFRRSTASIAPDARAQAVPDDAEDQFQIGLKFARESEETPDFAAAARCFRQAAEQGHVPAQLNLGLLLARGQGVPRDDDQAMMWLRKAAQDGNAAAQFNLGMKLYRALLDAQGEVMSESRIEAYKWLRLAAAQGFPNSEPARDGLNLAMTRDEVVDGNQRCAMFLAAQAVPHATPA